MPFKSILASLTGFNADRSVLDAAVAVARPGAAHIQCLHMRLDVLQTADFMAGISHKDDVVFDHIQKIAAQERARSENAKNAYKDARKRHALCDADRPEKVTGISISWQDLVTVEDKMPVLARYHDMTVMGRDRELSKAGILTVLMRSGRPLLLAPEKPVTALGHHVAIAWKETPEAARSVTAAMPLIAGAKHVTIACVSGSKAASSADRQAAEKLADQLAWHGISAEVHVEHRTSLSEPDTLRGLCYARGADLLVMGAYGHSRATELIFGGMTEGLLADCAIPVFMFH